jgi:PilZ domain
MKAEQDISTEVSGQHESQTGAPQDGRFAVRFPVHLPVQVVTSAGEFGAQTENISASGVLFIAEKSLEVDSKVEMFVRMPAESIGASEDVIVQCLGRVTRCMNDSEGSHVAALIEDYRFGKESGT